MRRLAILLAIALSAPGQSTTQAAGREVTVAAAANLSEVFQRIGPEFEAATRIHPVFSFGSTAQLETQIENGAPFDVFAAADVEHIRQLIDKKLIPPGSWSVYATGILALWIPPRKHGADEWPWRPESGLGESDRAGKARTGALRAGGAGDPSEAGIWDKVEAKIVYADNINMAKQYGTSGNADAVFTAYSLVMKEQGKVIQMDD